MKAGWKTVKLGDVADITSGLWKGELGELIEAKVYRATNFIGNGELSDDKLVSIPVELKKLTKRTLEPGDILLEKSGGGPNQPVGRVGFFGKSEPLHSFSNFTSRLRVRKGSSLDPKFLHKYLFWTHLRGDTASMQNNSTNIRNLDLDKYREIEIPLPPLTEQERIVALLDEAFAGIDEAKAKAEAAQRASAKIFESQVGLSFKENSAWKEATLSDLGETLTGTTPPTANPEYYGEYIPFVKPADFNEDGTLVVDNHGLSKEGMKVARVTNPDSVLMVCIGATIGKTGYTTTRITTNQQINSFTPGSLVNFKFAYYQMISSSFQKEVFARANQATMPMISKSKWSQISLRFPNNYDTQVKVAERLSELKFLTGKLSEIADRKVAALNEIRSSLLAQAFAGELTA